MTLIDAIIIYLAFGSPFVVLYVFETRTPFNAKRIAMVVLTTLFWQPHALKTLRTLIRTDQHFANRSDVDSYDDHRTGEILEILKAKFKSYEDGRLLFDSLERYIELHTAAEFDAAAPGEQETEFYTIAGHDDPAIASACLKRRSRDRLLRHAALARREVFRCVRTYDRPLPASELRELANLIQDASLIQLVESGSDIAGLRDRTELAAA